MQSLTADAIAEAVRDFTQERPLWPLSCYGVDYLAPRQVLEGEIEQSPEEMRLYHYMALAAGCAHESVQREAQLVASANASVQSILADLRSHPEFISLQENLRRSEVIRAPIQLPPVTDVRDLSSCAIAPQLEFLEDDDRISPVSGPMWRGQDRSKWYAWAGDSSSGSLGGRRGKRVYFCPQKKAYYLEDEETGNDERLWFFHKFLKRFPDIEAPASVYTGDLEPALVSIYTYVREHGVFEHDLMPEIPPRYEWISFDM